MRVLLDMTHPEDVHLFRHAVAELERRGHTVAVTARDKDCVLELLENLRIDHVCLSRLREGRRGRLQELVVRDAGLVRFARRFRPDVLSANGGVFAAHAGRLLGRPVVAWIDTEHSRLQNALTIPFATAVHTPDWYGLCHGRKQRVYRGFASLAYLHPRRFTPDPARVRALGIDPRQRYAVVRLVGWQAYHDVGQHGIGERNRVAFVQALARRVRPLITSEGPLPTALEPYRLTAPPEHLHQVLAFAALSVGEGATVAIEAALLGVPAVYVNTLSLGVVDRLERLGLIRRTTDADEALALCLGWLDDPRAGARCRAIRDRMLADRIDVTEYIVRTLEAYG
jgi:hypothetical protein